MFLTIVTAQSAAASCTSSVCLNLCCPKGQLYTKYEEDQTLNPTDSTGVLGRGFCSDQDDDDDDVTWSPDWADDDQEVSLVGDNIFSCDRGTLQSAKLIFGTDNIHVTRSGDLQILIEDDNNTQAYKYGTHEFCLAFTNIPDYYDYYYEGSGLVAESLQADFPVRNTFSVCYQVEEEKGQRFTHVFYTVALFISDFFIFVTLCVYLYLDDLRMNLFGKITIGFLFNVFFCYLFMGIHNSLDLYRNKHWLDSGFCIFLGYIIQHTFIAFFFWMSAMAINITRTLSNYFEERKHSKPMKTILLNICYAQGCPLLITILTAIMDQHGDPDNSILPGMGEFRCFLYEGKMETPFHHTPEFIYFYLVILIIMILNIVCFIITGFSLLSHWCQMRGMAQGSINELFKTQLSILSKLFIIMGIPWICDIISKAVVHVYGKENSFEVRVMLDILNLLAGVLLFLSLVCKRTVWTSLRTQWLGQGRYSPGTRGATTKQSRQWTFNKTSTTSL